MIAWFRAGVDLPENSFYEKVLFFTQLSYHLMCKLLKESYMLSITYVLGIYTFEFRAANAALAALNIRYDKWYDPIIFWVYEKSWSFNAFIRGQKKSRLVFNIVLGIWIFFILHVWRIHILILRNCTVIMVIESAFNWIKLNK